MINTSIFNRKSFTSKHKRAFDGLLSLSGIELDRAHVMVEINTKNDQIDTSSPLYPNADDLDTFVITTSADFENTITFETAKNVINLNVKDCGYF